MSTCLVLCAGLTEGQARLDFWARCAMPAWVLLAGNARPGSCRQAVESRGWGLHIGLRDVL